MRTPPKTPLPQFAAWRVEFVRLIAFPVRPPILIQQTWWKELTADRATDVLSTRKSELHADKGLFQDALLSLTLNHRRVTWEARPPFFADDSGNFPTFEGSVREKFDWFVRTVENWLIASCPPLRRLAFSAKLLQPAATAREAYEVLAAYLPTVSFHVPPNDFLLQINRRKEKSEVVEGLAINRLSTWSKMNVAVHVEEGKPFTWPERCYSALELDINTAPEKAEPLPLDSVHRLFKELVSLAIQIAECGENP